ncbi:hypothetical protein CDL15_Pgr014825 [Punica granatum]|uniref:Oleosin n=1 Tax=Punica granatum TaxID=22663 RepID=A0A218Y1W0_PUNGR|nr:hypothetical protein CDL15_Pgr014825 [Punica granatum]
MAEHHRLAHHQRPAADTQSIRELFRMGPTKSQVVVVLTLLPVGAILLLLAGLTLAGTLIGIAVTAPLFVIFSPILVPATLLIAFAVTGFLTSGAFGITALSAISWIVNFIRNMRGASLSEQVDHAKLRALETIGYLGHRTKEAGQAIQDKAHDEGRTHEGGRTREGTRATTTIT